MRFLSNPIGRKLVMAASGFSMIAFVLVHPLGNASLYYGPDGINAYAKALHSFPPAVWAFRIVMLGLFSLHFFYGTQLSLENSAAKPEAYAVKKSISSTFASRNMIWTGVVIASFLIFHLLHFTFQVIYPEFSAGTRADILGRPDVFTMVIKSFDHASIVALYIVGVFALGLHLFHGIESSIQTLGLNNEHTLPIVVKAGVTASAILFLAYAAIPVAVFAGIFNK